MAYEMLKQMITESSRIMVFSGMGLVRESGAAYFRDEPYAYQIEAKYGLSPEEFLSAAFYNSRPGSFYRFYKDEILSKRSDIKPMRPIMRWQDWKNRKKRRAEGSRSLLEAFAVFIRRQDRKM